MENTALARWSGLHLNPVEAAKKQLLKITSKGIDGKLAKIEDVARTKVDKFVDPKECPELHTTAHGVISAVSKLVADWIGQAAASRLKIQGRQSEAMPDLSLDGVVAKQAAHCLGTRSHQLLTDKGLGGLEGGLDQALAKGAALTFDKVNEIVDPKDYPHLNRALTDLVVQGTAITYEMLGKHISQWLGIPHTSAYTQGMPQASLTQEVIDDIKLFAARRARQDLTPHVEHGVEFLIEKIYSHQDAAFRDELRDKARGAVNEIASKAVQHVEASVWNHVRLRLAQQEAPESPVRFIEAGTKAWIFEDMMGPAAQFAFAGNQVSAAELGVRAVGALVAGTYGENAAIAFGTEAAVAMIPESVQNSELNQTVTKLLAAFPAPLEAGSRWIDQQLSFSDSTKAVIFQSVTTVGYTAVSQGGTFASYTATTFVGAVGRVGSALGLVDSKQFTAGRGGFKMIAAQCVTGYGTMTVAETARGYLGDEAAMFVYLAGNLVASPLVLQKLASANIHRRMGRGLVDLSASALKKTVLKKSDQPTPKKQPSLIRRALAYVLTPPDSQEGLWV